MNEYLKIITEYCKNNNLSLEKLEKQEKHLINKSFIVAQPFKPAFSDGLRTDLASQPKPTLIYNIDTGEVKETEYTDKYLR